MGRRSLIEQSVTQLTQQKEQLITELAAAVDAQQIVDLKNQLKNIEYIIELTEMNQYMRG